MFLHVPVVNSFLLLSRISLHEYSTFIYPVDGQLGCFHVLVITNIANVNIFVQAFLWMYIFIFLDKQIGGKLLGKFSFRRNL